MAFFNVFPGWKLVFKLFFQDGNGNLGPKKRLFHLFFLYGFFKIYFRWTQNVFLICFPWMEVALVICFFDGSCFGDLFSLAGSCFGDLFSLMEDALVLCFP